MAYSKETLWTEMPNPASYFFLLILLDSHILQLWQKGYDRWHFESVGGERAHKVLNQMVAMSKRIKAKQTLTHKIMFPITMLRLTMKYCLYEMWVWVYNSYYSYNTNSIRTKNMILIFILLIHYVFSILSMILN